MFKELLLLFLTSDGFDDKPDLDGILVYTPLELDDLVAVLSVAQSPLQVSDNYHEDLGFRYWHKNGLFKLGNGSVDVFVPLADKVNERIYDRLGGMPQSEIFTCEGVYAPSLFIPHFRTVVNYLNSWDIDFCIIGVDTNEEVHYIGDCIDKNKKANSSLLFPHTKLLD